MRFAPVVFLTLGSALLAACAGESPDASPASAEQDALVGLFMTGALSKDIETVDCTLSDGTETSCYEITVAGTPVGRGVGPFCPPTTTATAAEGGIWMDGNNLYDVTGQFILDLPIIYNDDQWKLYDSAGNVRITATKEAFEAAARPDVADEFENYCVEGRMEWLDGGVPITTTVRIPVTPVPQASSTQARAPLGVTFTGTRIDAAAPVDAILGAHTIAPFDDCGGHMNPFEGYHMHAATGCGEVGDAPEDETPPFAVAMDGHLIHSPLNSPDLDACNGHTTAASGYHYHARSPELNGVLNCYMGATAENGSDGPAGGGPPGGGPPGGGPPGGGARRGGPPGGGGPPPQGEGVSAPAPHDHR